MSMVINVNVLHFDRLTTFCKDWEKGFVHVLWHERPNFFCGLRCGESFEEEFLVGLELDHVGLGGFLQGKEHDVPVRILGDTSDKEPVAYARVSGLDNNLGDTDFNTRSAALSSGKPTSKSSIA